MLYDLIRRKRDRWFAEIPVTHAAKDIMRYILKKDALRDAQIDAVNELLNKINEILVLKCEEAEKCYSEYQVLASERH